MKDAAIVGQKQVHLHRCEDGAYWGVRESHARVVGECCVVDEDATDAIHISGCLHLTCSSGTSCDCVRSGGIGIGIGIGIGMAPGGGRGIPAAIGGRKDLALGR